MAQETQQTFVYDENFHPLDFNKDNNVDILDTYHGYYGIGFYLISAPLDLFFSNENKHGFHQPKIYTTKIQQNGACRRKTY